MIRDVLFNPAFLSDEQAIRQFVIRHELLTPLLNDIEADYSPINPHTIVIGARGFGKSSLLRRVTAEINTRPALRARWFPVVFPEEPYEVGNLGELWLEALRVVAMNTGDRTINQLREELHRDRDADRVGRIARDQLRSFAEARGVRLVLVIENLDMLLTETFSEDDAWALRGVLQTDPTFFLLASAVRRFEGITDHDKPFYDSLRRLELEPLNAEEIHQLWGEVSGRPPGINRAKALRVLTGGNPRMVRLLAQLAHGHRLSDILNDLSGLIDRHTDYFKGNIESLTGQQRRVFLAVANLWRPAVAAEIAAEARLDNNGTSVALQRLERQGRLEVVGVKGKNRLYQVAERLYNIYYLMRRGQGVDARIQAVIDFMVHFYEPPELGGLVERLLAEPKPERGGERPSVDVVCGLMAAHLKNTEARAAVIGALPEEVVSQLPKKELALARRRPKELLALLEGPAGHRFVEDGERMLSKSSQEDPVLKRIAEVVLRLAPERVKNAAMYLVWHTQHKGIDVFDAPETSRAARESLALMASFRAFEGRDPIFPAVWLFRVQQHNLLERDGLRDGRSALRVMSQSPGWEQEVQGAMRLVTDIPLALQNLILSCLGNEAAIRTIWRELVAAEATPLHLGALALIHSGHLDVVALEPVVEQLAVACAEHGLVSVGLALFYIDIGQRERAVAYLGAHARSIKPAARLGCLILADAPAGEIHAAWADTSSLWPHEPALWELLYSTSPAAALSGWCGLTEEQRVAAAPSLVIGAVRSEARSVWELATSAYEAYLAHQDTPLQDVFVAWLYGRLGRPDRALDCFEALLIREDAAAVWKQHITELALALGAVGLRPAVATAIHDSPHSLSLSPLLVAMAPDSPDLRPSAEELTIGEDLCARMKEMAACADLWVKFTPPPPLPMPVFTLADFRVPTAKPAKRRPRNPAKG